MEAQPLRWPSRPYSLTPDTLLRVRREHGLSPACALVLAAVVSYDHQLAGGRKGVVWPRVAAIAADAELSERQTRRHLATLAERGLVVPLDQGGGRGRAVRRRVCWEALVPDGPGPRPAETLSPPHRPARETLSPAPRPHKEANPGREKKPRHRGPALAGAAPATGRSGAESAPTPRPSARVAADLTPEQREEVRLRVAAERDPVARCRRMAEALAAYADAAG